MRPCSEISMSRTLFCFFFPSLVVTKGYTQQNFLFHAAPSLNANQFCVVVVNRDGNRTAPKKKKTRQKRRIVSLLGDHFVISCKKKNALELNVLLVNLIDFRLYIRKPSLLLLIFTQRISFQFHGPVFLFLCIPLTREFHISWIYRKWGFSPLISIRLCLLWLSHPLPTKKCLIIIFDFRYFR